MSDKGKDLLKALFFLIIGICCAALALTGKTGGRTYPWVGALLCLFMTVNYVKKSFED